MPVRRRIPIEPAIRRVACSNYLWILLKEATGQGELEAHWYGGLELERLTLV